MLYLYTLMMFAWDLDNDTHAYFRGYLDVFINKRKISKNLREYVINTRSRAITGYIRPGHDTESIFNELRISLPNRIERGCRPLPHIVIPDWVNLDNIVVGVIDYNIYQGGRILAARYQIWDAPKEIDDIHPPKYYHTARKLSAPSRSHTNP